MKTQRSDLEATLELLQPDADRASAEYPIRVAAVSKLLESYGEKTPERLDHFVDVLWNEVPAWWLALAIRRLVAERVYPTLPTPGDLRRVARELAGMDRPTYHAAVYLDAPRREWPPPGRRHAITQGQLEALPKELVRVEAGQRAALTEGA